MFQNISREYAEEQEKEDVELNKKNRIKQVLIKLINKQNIILYTVSVLVSMVCIGGEKSLCPFGLSIIIAALSNCIPVGIVSALVITTTCLITGVSNALNLVLTILILIISVAIKGTKYGEESYEKRKLGVRLFFASFIVQAITLFIKGFVIYDILVSLMYSITAYIFYKIFTRGIDVIINVGEKRVYAIEEVMAASLLLTIAISAFGNLSVFGFSVRNILCILIVMIMGWKNGLLVGATTGITIGTVLGVIGDSNPILVASFALSGLIAGIFSKLGKIGVVIGFVIGNVLLTYVVNGNTVPIIMIQEILIASIGLLAIPKNIKININDIYKTEKLLPETTGRTLEENKETIFKLNSMSETIGSIAKSYSEAAATILDEKELKKQEEENVKTFEYELQNNLEGLEENILFDDIYSGENGLIKDIFDILLENEQIKRKDLLDILANHNSYIVGYETEYINDEIENDIKQILKAINEAYKVSKINFIWKKKLDENKKTVSNQLEEVSKAIEKLAQDIEQEEIQEDEFKEYKEQIKLLLEQKDIQIKDCNIKRQKNFKDQNNIINKTYENSKNTEDNFRIQSKMENIINNAKSGKIKVTLYTDKCENVDKPTCDIKKMCKIISKVMGQEMVLQKQECALRLNQDTCSYVFTSDDKMSLQIGIAKTQKTGSTISGDTSVQTKLEDGKYLLAISDGMGSGKEARKSSRMAIGMLEKLLSSGFEKDTSLRLINSALKLTNSDEMYATLDIMVLDLYDKKLEFIKNGACPTYVKNSRNVQILKSVNLPTGMLEDIDLVVYDKDLSDGDIIVMCSDGIIESTMEFQNKELWLKYLLEEIETDDVQKIADIILNEAIDNNYGNQKDDMTVLVAKVKNKVNFSKT